MNDGMLAAPDLPELLAYRAPDGRTRRILVSRDWPPKRRDITERLEMMLGAAPAVCPPLATEIHSDEDGGEYRRQKISYQLEPGERCRAWLLLPKPEAYRRPALLCCHQTVPEGKDEPAGLAGRPSMHYAVELVRQGYVCLVPDSITAGERVYPGADPFETAPFYQLHPEWSALGKMLWDHQRALDVLGSLDHVDPDRIGVIGHSLGGENAMMLGAFDHRVKVTVASCAYVPFAVDPEPSRWCRDHWFVYMPGLRSYIDRGLHPPFLWVEVLGLIAPRALCYSYAAQDSIFPNSWAVAEDMRQLGRLYDLLGARARLAYYEDPGDHDFPEPARERAYRLIHSVLRAQWA